MVLGVAALPATSAEFAPTGTMRGTVLAANPVQASIDPATGAVHGPAADLVRDLAQRLAVPFSITGVGGCRP